jgi:hypothetical protein
MKVAAQTPFRHAVLLCALLTCTADIAFAEWRPLTEPDPDDAAADLFYAKRTAERPADGKQLSAHLAFFDSRAYRLDVVDLGAGPEPTERDIDDALRAAGCTAGVNGGFFHPDYSPLGLVIADGKRSGRFQAGKLLSGVIYSDDRGIHLTRRAAFRDHPGIHALLQTGPYLVENRNAVRGLSDSRPARRTFIATDWRRNWVIGATTSSVTLADLADALATPGALTSWPVNRAINLDGGSSTGFFVEAGDNRPARTLQPLKRVRNLLCVTTR